MDDKVHGLSINYPFTLSNFYIKGNMDIERQNSYKSQHRNHLPQPEFHERKMNICEKYCGYSFCGIIKSYKLTQEEIESFNNLKKVTVISYDTTDHNHENLLALLYYNAFGCKLDDENEPKWKEIGFQVYKIIT